MKRKIKVKIIAVILALSPLLFSIDSWGDENSNLDIQELNCNSGSTITCYGNICKRGLSTCYSNPCPNCGGGGHQL